MKATAKSLRLHTKDVLEALDRGEEVIITHRGKPRAKVVPISPRRRTRKRSSLFGIWADRSDIGSVEAYVNRIRSARR